ncbi:MAG: sugar phosphate isomerase/epimerase family protein [Bacilli bacterium]
MALIGAQLYTVREYLKTPEDVVSTLEKIKKIGYRCVQLSGLKDFTDETIIDTFSNTCKRLGLEVVVTHITYPLLSEQFEYVVNMHKKLNCKYVGIGSIIPEIRNNPSKEKYIEYANKLEELAQRLEKEGLKLVYHNHEFEFAKDEDGNNYYSYICDNTKLLQLEVDVFWIQRAGKNPKDVLLKLNNRIDIIHLKDYVVYHDGHDLRSEIRYGYIGEGNLDFDEIIESAVKSNCQYMLVEQDDCYGLDPFDCLEKSYN